MKTNRIISAAVALLWVTSFVMAFTACTNKQNINAQNDAKTTWAEKLGYPAGKKVIILHADDAGMCEEANIAIESLLENHHIQAAAVMAPCPYADDFIKWATDHPQADVGMHLTLTSEWKTWRWGPVSDPATVPGLIDPEGKLWHEVPDVLMHATADEVEKEIRAQIDKAIALGHRPSHIDTHMGTLYGSAAFAERFFKVAEEYGIPANAIDLSDTLVANHFRQAGYPIDDKMISILENYTLPKLDFFTSAPHGRTYEEKVESFKQLIQSLPEGLTEIIFHPSVETDNLKTITNSWQQRVWEARMFADPDLINFFKDEGIIFTNWKEIMSRFSDTKKSASNTETKKAESSDEWISLFNGENLDGWTVHGDAKWTVQNGILTGQTTGGQGHIYADPVLTDLEVKGMFRINDLGGGANSGLYFRANPPEDNPDGFPRGYEAQICNNQDAYTGWLWKPGTPTGKADTLLTKDGEWFPMRVKAVGDLIQIWVKNRLVMTYRDDEYKKGQFAIQCHNPGMTIEAKDLYYRDLSK
ncbi:MAG: ChbG/HpnK family deacetylase [Chlorobi bacterium]|nr:ChbG/HpnK family deacetylase [Chlorobiota bacterium]